MILKLEREISDHHAPSFGFELLCALALMKFEAFEVNYTRVDKIFRTSLRSRRSFSKARKGNESASKCEKLRSKMSRFSWKTYPFRAHFLSLFLFFFFGSPLPTSCTVFVWPQGRSFVCSLSRTPAWKITRKHLLHSLLTRSICHLPVPSEMRSFPCVESTEAFSQIFVAENSGSTLDQLKFSYVQLHFLKW